MDIKKPPVFKQLLPILFVKDMGSEILFYKNLGFEISYQGEEFPGFVGLKSGSVEFGLEQKEDFDSSKARDSFTWQMDIAGFGEVIRVCKLKGIEYSEPKQYWTKMDGWEMTLKSPNGYLLHLEKIGRA